MRLSLAAISLSFSALFTSVTAHPSSRWVNDPSDKVPSGYVTTKGTEFWLNHYPYYFNGANAYWLPQLVYDYQYDQVFKLLESIGVTVIRTWAFSTLEETPTNNVTYYQFWVNGTSL